ncbi:hypothetical protein FRC03_003647 [Tulasnella sp. 419]|nr:hypothetical protein FRC03_003647 [Tulasnella sp. 419]
MEFTQIYLHIGKASNMKMDFFTRFVGCLVLVCAAESRDSSCIGGCFALNEHNPLPECPQEQPLYDPSSKTTFMPLLRAVGKKWCQYDLGYENDPRNFNGIGYARRGGKTLKHKEITAFTERGYTIAGPAQGDDGTFRMNWAIATLSQEQLQEHYANFKEFGQTRFWQSAQGVIINVDPPRKKTFERCQEYLETNVYSFISDIYQEILERVFGKDTFNVVFMLNDPDFDAFRFTDDMTMVEFDRDKVEDLLETTSDMRYRSAEKYFDKERLVSWFSMHSQYSVLMNCPRWRAPKVFDI